jgi:hypothetical protein
VICYSLSKIYANFFFRHYSLGCCDAASPYDVYLIYFIEVWLSTFTLTVSLSSLGVFDCSLLFLSTFSTSFGTAEG